VSSADKIGDVHAALIQMMEACEIVGVGDRDPLMAKRLYDSRSNNTSPGLTELVSEAAQ
jgi:hypothetical protein